MADRGGATGHGEPDGIPGLIGVVLLLNALIVVGALLFVLSPPHVGAPVLFVAVLLSMGPLAAPVLAVLDRGGGDEDGRRDH